MGSRGTLSMCDETWASAPEVAQRRKEKIHRLFNNARRAVRTVMTGKERDLGQTFGLGGAWGVTS